jgi:hypothetical protein
MAWRIGLVALLLLWSAAAAARHGSGVIEPRRATPGIRLELVELPSSSGTAKYRLRAEGVPRGVAFDVWTKDFGQPFKEALSGFRTDEAGALVSTDASGRPRRLEDIEFDPGPYPRGAVWMVAIASDDHKLSAFAKITPHPIAARDGACTVSLELISLLGTRFLASGAGFVPGEYVDIELRSAGRVTHRKQRVSAEGSLPSDVVPHGGIGADLSARYAVKALSCGPAVEYEWGEAALKRR